MGLCSQSVRVAAAGACLNTGNYFQLLCDLPPCVLILAFLHRNPWWSLQKLSKISWRNGDVVSYAGFRCTAFNKSPSAASICICLAAQWRRVWTNMNFNPRQPRRGGARMREQLQGFNKYFASPAELLRRRTPPARAIFVCTRYCENIYTAAEKISAPRKQICSAT